MNVWPRRTERHSVGRPSRHQAISRRTGRGDWHTIRACFASNIYYYFNQPSVGFLLFPFLREDDRLIASSSLMQMFAVCTTLHCTALHGTAIRRRRRRSAVSRSGSSHEQRPIFGLSSYGDGPNGSRRVSDLVPLHCWRIPQLGSARLGCIVVKTDGCSSSVTLQPLWEMRLLCMGACGGRHCPYYRGGCFAP